jgi:hypothetical protein
MIEASFALTLIRRPKDNAGHDNRRRSPDQCPRCHHACVSGWIREELGTQASNRGDHEATVEEVIEQLATGFADEKATVTGRALEIATFVDVIGQMLGADRVVRTEPADLQG